MWFIDKSINTVLCVVYGSRYLPYAIKFIQTSVLMFYSLGSCVIFTSWQRKTVGLIIQKTNEKSAM